MPRLVELVGHFAPVPLVLRDDPRVTAAHALTYGAVLSCLADRGGAGELRLRRIVDRSWRKTSAVRQHLDDLEAWGYLQRKRTPGRASYFRLDRLVLEQLALEFGDPAGLGQQGSGANPAGSGRQTTARVYADDPAGSYRKNPAGVDRQTPRTFKEKTGAAQNPNGKAEPVALGEVIDEALAFPTSGPFARLDPHAWDTVTPNDEADP